MKETKMFYKILGMERVSSQDKQWWAGVLVLILWSLILTSLEDVKTSRGAEGEKLLEAAKKAKGERTPLCTQFSAVYGPPTRLSEA